MRFLGVGQDLALGDMYLRLVAAGHEVRAYAAEPNAQDVLRGMLPRVDNWQAELDWIRAARTDGVILFETASMGATQDALRRDGFQVVGGSAFGDRLEQDREFGQAALRAAGMKTASTRTFA